MYGRVPTVRTHPLNHSPRISGALHQLLAMTHDRTWPTRYPVVWSRAPNPPSRAQLPAKKIDSRHRVTRPTLRLSKARLAILQMTLRDSLSRRKIGEETRERRRRALSRWVIFHHDGELGRPIAQIQRSVPSCRIFCIDYVAVFRRTFLQVVERFVVIRKSTRRSLLSQEI